MHDTKQNKENRLQIPIINPGNCNAARFSNLIMNEGGEKG